MLDIKFIREHLNKVKDNLRKRGMKVDVDKILDLDKKKRENLKALEDILAQKNKASKNISSAKARSEKQKLIKAMQKIDKKGDKLKDSLKVLKKELENLMYQLPNISFEEVPEGKDENDNKVIRQRGKIPKFDFKIKDHIELGKILDIIDIERAAKASGSRFYYLKNEAVLLEFALISYIYKFLSDKDFIPISPPLMLRERPYMGIGRLSPGERDERYYIPRDELYLIGSAEHTIGPFHMEEILKEKELPKRYLGFSSCLRREAGSYGKDTRGILRAHQFDKVEMFSFTTPEQSNKEHEFLFSIQEKLMQSLNLPYQVVLLCTGDIGFTDAKQYDIETWMPGQNKYRETHSCSNTTDFQARGINCRYRKNDGSIEFVHMLNATGFAIGRTLIAILENYQQKDGSVEVPKVLQPYTGFKKIKPKM